MDPPLDKLPIHLLPPDLQMYILAQDSHLLLLASHLSKSFHYRSLPYLYTQFRDQPVPHRTIFNYINSYSPVKWYRVLYSNNENKVYIIKYKSKGECYEQGLRYTFHKSSNNYNLQLSRQHNEIFLSKKQLIYAFNYNDDYFWFFDLITRSQVLTQRTFCLQQDPNYIRNYLLDYLSTLRQHVKTPTGKMAFFTYLILNLMLYGQESYSGKTSWSEEIEGLIEIKYQKLVTYLQKN